MAKAHSGALSGGLPVVPVLLLVALCCWITFMFTSHLNGHHHQQSADLLVKPSTLGSGGQEQQVAAQQQHQAQVVHGELYTPQHAMTYYWPGAQPNAEVKACVDKMQPVQAAPKPYRLAIIMTTNERSHNSEELNATASNWRAYAARHNYTFIINHVKHQEEYQQLHLFVARWASILDRNYTQHYDFILGVDGDTMVINMSRSLDGYMDMASDVWLNVRENGETAASCVLFRTSPFGLCFMRYWVSLGYKARLENADNGDLLQAVMDFLDPDLGRRCSPLRQTYGDQFMPCFRRLHWRFVYVHTHFPIRVFPPLSGFWRTWEGLERGALDDLPGQLDPLNLKCWSTDIIGHGWKAMGRTTWVNHTGDDVSCSYMTAAEELAVARRNCLWFYPGCWRNQTYNICRFQWHCPSDAFGIPPAFHNQQF